MDRFQGKVVIVTEGSRGIGLATCKSFAQKGAIISLTRAMAVELAPYGIRVNAISPGPVYTEMFTNNVTTEEARQRIADSAPLGRVGQAEDITRGILYLASTDSDWCTGQSLSVDGGLSILK